MPALRFAQLLLLALPLGASAGTQVLAWFPLAAGWNAEKLGLAAFVQPMRTGEVLQAVMLPVCLPAAS